MSEDRLEKALEAMKNESVNPEELAGARARVWEKLEAHGAAACAEFQPGFREYLDGRLAGNRRLLMEDHLSRCPQCRTQLAALKGEQKVIAMPQRRASWWPRWGTWAAAAALVLAALYLGRDRIDTLLAPARPARHGGFPQRQPVPRAGGRAASRRRRRRGRSDPHRPRRPRRAAAGRRFAGGRQ